MKEGGSGGVEFVRRPSAAEAVRRASPALKQEPLRPGSGPTLEVLGVAGERLAHGVDRLAVVRRSVAAGGVVAVAVDGRQRVDGEGRPAGEAWASKGDTVGQGTARLKCGVAAGVLGTAGPA